MSELGKTTLRVGLGALAVWMVPFTASRFIADWHWDPRGWVLAYVLFFATGMVYALVARRMDAWAYKAGVGVALVTGFALGWSTVVQTADSGHPENFLFLSVLAVGLIGALLSRLGARGLARTLFAMAAAMVLISLMLPSWAPPDMALRMAVGHAGDVALFTIAGLLFRRASLVEPAPAM